MRVFILAAGQGFQLDGINKVLIRDPQDGKRILDKYIEIFKNMHITVIVGYSAINIMNRYPQLDYVYNPDWKLTNNSYTLGLALTDEPCYVLSSDLIFGEEVIKKLHEGPSNCVLTENRDNRILTAINCVLDDNDKIIDVYQGDLKNTNDPEAIGIYKITDKQIVKKWKRNCLEHPNLFVGQNLPLKEHIPICAIDKGPYRFEEINTPLDYLRLLEKSKTRIN